MATNETRPDPRRLRYFNGLIMKEEEFILEQDYHVRMRRLHNRHLHGRGIVWGLEVGLGNTTNEVLVSAGMALDNYFDQQFSEESSRELILTDDCEVDLSAYSSGDRVWIWLTYAEEQVEIVPDRGGQEPIHIRESAVINHSTDDPGDRDSNIVLAIVEFGPSGVVDLSAIKDNDNGELVRLTAAFKSDRLDTEVLTLRDPALAVGAEPAFLDGFVFEDTGDIGIVVNSDRTRFTAAVDVDTDLTVEQATRLKGDVQMDQNLTVFGDIVTNQNAVIDGDLTVNGNFVGRLPLGGVVAVFDYGANVPATSTGITGDGFMLADGQVLPTTTALYAMASANSRPTTRPDLTNDVFVMGATSSGNVGGANSVSVVVPAHNHDVTALGIVGNGILSISGETGGISFDNGLGSHAHVANNVVDGSLAIANLGVPGLTEPNNAVNRVTTGPDRSINHGHSLSGGTVDLSGLDVDGSIGAVGGISGDIAMTANPHENRPNYISAIYLIRVN